MVGVGTPYGGSADDSPESAGAVLEGLLGLDR